VSTARAEASPAPRTAPRRAALGALAVLGLVALDLGAVAAALPSVRLDLGSSTSGLVWVQDGYLLALAVGLMPAAAARAALDGRVVALAGAIIFAGGAVLAATADSTAALVTGRVLQGAGTAALLTPLLAPPGPGRAQRPDTGSHATVGARAARAGAVWPAGRAALAAAALLALAMAPLVGGGVAEEAHWRWLFRLEAAAALPVAVLVLTAAAGGGGRGALARGDGDKRTAALAAGLVCAVTGLVQSGPWGWASADTLLLLAAGAALLGYAWRDGLGTRDSLALTLAGALAAALLLAPQYLELVRGLSPLRSGVLTLALTLPAAAAAVAASLLAGRLPQLPIVTAGLGCAALGALGMTRIDAASSYALVVLSLALLGTGIGAAAAGLANRTGVASPAGVADRAGPAAAGAALLVAASGALLLRAQVEERESGGSFEDALAAGVAASGWLLAALLAVAAALAWRRI
jgi:MFS family permease